MVGEETTRTVTTSELSGNYQDAEWMAGACLRDGVFDSINVPGADFSRKELSRANFQNAKLKESNFSFAKANRTTFVLATLSDACFRSADLRDADFTSATLDGADLRGAQLTPDSKFRGAKVRGMRIDRHSLMMLGPGRGGLTDADISTMEIEDDQAKLLLSFGGFWSAIHVLAGLVFFLPYIFYAARKYIDAYLNPCFSTECKFLWRAVLDYAIYRKEENVDFLAITIFLLLAVYNVLRVVLVIKARSLAFREKVYGLPQEFTFTKHAGWKISYLTCIWLGWVNVALISIHASQILGTLVPA